MATIFSPRGQALTTSAADALWLARAVEAEGGPEWAVAQTLVNRWAWLADYAPGAYPHLRDLVQAYAQAVNPRWLEGGDLFEGYVREHPDKRESELVRSARRRANRERNDFSDVTRSAVHQALDGPITLAPGIVHFGHPVNNQNQFFTGDGSARWALYTLGVDGPRSELGLILERGKPSAAIGVLLLGIGGAFVATRGYKRRARR